MVRTLQFACPREAALPAVGELAGGDGEATHAIVTRTVLDTFDRRLAARGLLLILDDDGSRRTVYLRRRDGEQIVDAELPEQPPLLIAELPDRRLRRALADVIEARALIAQARWQVAQQRVECRDSDAKSLGVVAVEQQQFGGSASATTVCAIPRRGYAQELGEHLAAWPGAGVLEPLAVDSAAAIADTLQDDVPAHSAKCRVPLDPEQPPGVALAALLGACRAVMAANLPGLRDDTDIEFLHEFRIAVRRARSLLRRFPDTTGTAAPLSAELAWLGAVTGPPRDLDVWLHEPGAPEATSALEAFLTARRAEARKHLVAALDSPRFARVEQAFAAHLEALGGAGGGPHGALADVFGRAVWKQYRRVSRTIARHPRQLAPAELHRLRKQAKCLRYLIDAGAPLYPERRIRRLERDLKRVQSSAGALCDDLARTDLIDGWLAQDLDEAVRTALLEERARHALPAKIELKRKRFRALADSLARFDRPKNRARYRALFRPRRR